MIQFRTNFFPKDVRDPERELRVIRETLQQRHPNLVHTYGIFEITEAKIFGIAMELCDCSLRDIHGKLRVGRTRSFSPMPLKQVADFLTQILKGLSYLHAKDIIHR